MKLNTKLMEIAILRALPEAINIELKGRMKNQIGIIKKVADKELEYFLKVTNADLFSYGKFIDKWLDMTGWRKKPLHIVTIASFLLEMLEKSQHKHNQRFFDALFNIFDYHERAKDTYRACYTSGALAYEKWVRVLGEMT